MKKPITLQSVRGMNDILPPDSFLWEKIERRLKDVLALYDFSPIRLPIVEATPLFSRAIGEVTDIVEKEMYSFVDALNDEKLTLRPEGTAGCVRAFIQHQLGAQNNVQKLYYLGPMFRHERPQKGRYRQFHQLGVECLGSSSFLMDAEIIALSMHFWRNLNIKTPHLHLNSLGDLDERTQYRAALVDYFTRYENALDEDSKRRLHQNPLRILDSKNPDLKEICESAPKLFDFLGSASRHHFEKVQETLNDLNIPYCMNHRLVRGLDYYNRTVFEWISDDLGAQGTVCAGGRYDSLVEQLGGKITPACGFALGLERLMLLLQNQEKNQPLVFMVHSDEAALKQNFLTAEKLRQQGIGVRLLPNVVNFKNQFKKADQSGAEFALILAQEEMQQGFYTLKTLRGENAQKQEKLSYEEVFSFFKPYCTTKDER